MPDTKPVTPELQLWQRPGLNRPHGSPCPLCGDPTFPPIAFAITTPDGTPVCEGCVERHFTPGLWELLEGIDNIDTALLNAADADRPAVLAFALDLLTRLRERYTPEPEPPTDKSTDWPPMTTTTKESTMNTTTAHPYKTGDLVQLSGNPGACSHCGDQVTAALGVVVENGIYATTLITMVDRSFTGARSTARICCAAEELEAVDTPDTIHASPEDVTAAVTAGWLPPGSEARGCEFRTVRARART